MLRVFALALMIGTPMMSFAKDIFISSQSQVSNRFAVFEDNERVAVLYLTEAGRPKPMKDAIAYSRVPPASSVDWARIKETGEIPPLTKDVASEEAVIASPSEEEFSFRWSADGNAVALLRNGRPIAFVSASEKYGYSRAVAKSSAIANAWDEKKYAALFGGKP